MSYNVQILDKALSPITQLVEFYPLDPRTKRYLSFSSKLSGYGECKFRVGTKDPIWDQYGAIFTPYQNHVRIYEDGGLVWQGIIINNPHRNKNFIEIQAYEYEFLFKKVLIAHDVTGDQNYRTLKSGTMANAIQAFITEGKAKAGAASPLNLVQLGSIDNPLFPAGYVNTKNVAVAGQQWVFSDDFQLKFDYRDTEYILQSLALYSQFDYELVTTLNSSLQTVLTFNFKQYIGTKDTGLVFEYGPYGAIEDYDSPLDGENMVNSLTGVAADNDFNILAVRDLPFQPSVDMYGLVQGVAAYGDAKNINALRSRMTEELTVNATPDTELHLVLGDKSFPLSQYGIGDSARFIIRDHYTVVDQTRRIVARQVDVDAQGRKTVVIVTNIPRDSQR